MANQKITLKAVNRRGIPRDLRVTLVDSDGGAATFTDYGAAALWYLDDDLALVDAVGQGTTPPATATSFQFRVNGTDRQAFINGASAFDPTSTAQARLGSAAGQWLTKGSALAITGRA